MNFFKSIPQRIRRLPLYLLISPFYLLLWLIVQLPHRVRLAIGRFIGWLVMACTPRGCEVTRTNIRLCFPEMGEVEREAFLRRSYASLGMGFIEAAMAWHLPTWRLRRLLTIEGEAHIHAAQSQGKGLLCLGLHMTCMELAGRLMHEKIEICPMYQKAKNSFLDDLIHSFRKNIYGNNIVPNNNIRTLINRLAENKMVWYAPDQSPSHKRSVFVPFFGISAATSTTTAQIARLSDAPVIPIASYRKPDHSGYIITLLPPLENYPSDDEHKNAQITNQIIEELIKRSPEQYLWQYKRFKLRPPGDEKAFY